jgi:hypothetical protein
VGVAWVVPGRTRARQATPIRTVSSRENIVAIAALFFTATTTLVVYIEGFLQSPSEGKDKRVERALLILEINHIFLKFLLFPRTVQ